MDRMNIDANQSLAITSGVPKPFFTVFQNPEGPKVDEGFAQLLNIAVANPSSSVMVLLSGNSDCFRLKLLML